MQLLTADDSSDNDPCGLPRESPRREHVQAPAGWLHGIPSVELESSDRIQKSQRLRAVLWCPCDDSEIILDVRGQADGEQAGGVEGEVKNSKLPGKNVSAERAGEGARGA